MDLEIVSWLVYEIYIDYIMSKGAIFFAINVEIQQMMPPEIKRLH